jgi:glycosyltransferase involved in cell wall biosynthesis
MPLPSIAILDLIGLVYDGNTLKNRGLGGSESAVILISRELSKLGFPVTVFNACGEDDSKPGIYDGVNFRHIHSLTPNDKFDIVISSRTVVPFIPEHYYHAFNQATRYPCKIFETIRKNAKMKVLWMHDTFCNGDNILEELAVQGYIDKIFTLSDFHTAYVTNCHHGKRRNFEVMKNKMFITRNGVVNYFDEVDISAKDKNLFVYNASVTKGMLPLIDSIWPKVKHYIPNGKLKIVGGYYKFRDDSPLDAQGETLMKLKEEQRYKDIDIEFTGIITQKQIAELLAKASFFLFPGAFPETFGISTLESLTYNTPLVATRFGALEETAIDLASYFIDYAIEPNSLFTEINSEEQVNHFVNKIVKAYNDPYLHQQKQYYCNVIKDINTWDTVALQWKQLFLKQFNLYLPVNEYRQVSYINDKIHRVFGRRISNKEEWNTHKIGYEEHIAIITPFYNAEKYIINCLESVASQDYDNYHMYLIDDASTDNSRQIVKDFIESLPLHMQSRFILICNNENRGAVYNQIHTIKNYPIDDSSLIMLLDGDDSLKNDNNIFNFYNNLFSENKTEYAYGSCWSLADNIPLIAQPYPASVRKSKSYRNHRFNWGMPYPHLRVFKRKLVNNINDEVFKDEFGNWFKAGGDNATFYNIIEQADPNKVTAVQEIFYNYNDLNPLNDYKVHGELQNKNAAKITSKKSNIPDFMSSVEESRSVVVQENIETSTLDNFMVETKQTVAKNIMKKRILIAIPTAKNIEAATFKSIYDLIIPEGYEATFQYFYGYQVDQVRNLIADWVVKGYDYLFAVDSDIAFPSDTLVRLLGHNKDIVSAIYRQRVPETQILEIFEKNDRGGFTHIPFENLRNAGLMEVGACGFGCALIKKKVMVDIGYPQFQYRSALNHNDTFSEDLDFCRKASLKGFKIYADTTILCEHIGSFVFKVS